MFRRGLRTIQDELISNAATNEELLIENKGQGRWRRIEIKRSAKKKNEAFENSKPHS